MGVHEETSGNDDQMLDVSAPLLGKSSGVNGADATVEETLISVPSFAFGFNYNSRPTRDVTFAVVFLTFVVGSIVVGGFAVAYSNYDLYSLPRARYHPDTGCTVAEDTRAQESLKLFVNNGRVSNLGSVRKANLNDVGEHEPDWYLLKFIGYVFWVTVMFGAPIAFGLLYLLRKHTAQLVYVTLPFTIFIPLVLDILLFVHCYTDDECSEAVDPKMQAAAFVFVLLLLGLSAWIIYSNWDRIELTIRIIHTASEALYRNLGLLFVLPGLNVGYLFYFVPALFFMVAAYQNGKIVPNPEMEQDPDIDCGADGGQCCVWQTDSWVPSYITLTGFTLLWSAVVLAQINVFTISGTVAQWYFAPAESSTIGTTKRSLGNACGPSFGTVCFAGLIVTFVRIIRSIANQSRTQNGQQGLMSILIRCCLEYLLRTVEFLTKFTTNFAAIIGESFCASAVMTFHLLQRNLLSTVVVEAVSGRVLNCIVFVTSSAYGFLVYGVLSLFTKLDQPSICGLCAFVFLLFVLVFFLEVLKNIIDAVYICYAMDKDSNVVSKSEVHDVYVLLPSSKDETASLAVRR